MKVTDTIMSQRVSSITSVLKSRGFYLKFPAGIFRIFFLVVSCRKVLFILLAVGVFSTFPSDSLRKISSIFWCCFMTLQTLFSVEMATEHSQLGFLPMLIFQSRLRHIIQG